MSSSKQVTLSLALAGEMYRSDNENLRKFALENYPELEMKITDRVKSYDDACKVLGRPVCNFSAEPMASILRPYEIARRKLEVITEALNEGWKPDWMDRLEYKYYPWLDLSSPGSGFSYDGYDCVNSCSAVGSRLVFKTHELAEYVAKQFSDLYKEMML